MRAVLLSEGDEGAYNKSTGKAHTLVTGTHLQVHQPSGIPEDEKGAPFAALVALNDACGAKP